ncbi:hypothetical protein C8J57DRAFT_1496896 [Mycena rebaudengoi]|nr:hypothetical protein C8J57DRAFT_1496896 [Mycena rebaudengoi]
MLTFDAFSAPYNELSSWIRAQPRSLVNTQLHRDFTLPEFQTSGAMRDAATSEYFRAIVFGAVASSPYLDPYSRMCTVNLRCPAWSLGEDSAAFQSQVSHLHVAARAISDADSEIVHPLNITRWTSAASSEVWSNDDYEELQRAPPDDHIVLDILATSLLETQGRAPVLAGAVHNVDLAAGDTVIAEVVLRWRRYVKKGVPLRHHRLLVQSLRIVTVEPTSDVRHPLSHT